ncbi:MAG: monooxygenase [bacterium]
MRAPLSPLIPGIAAIALVLSACAAGSPSSDVAASSDATASSDAAASSEGEAAVAAPAGPLVTVALEEPYAPSAQGTSTDDYRCFLLATDTVDDRFITGVRFSPGNPQIVHHAILYRVDPSQVEAAQQRDAEDEGQGWTCFGGPDLPSPPGDDAGVASLDSAPWLAAWAPGGKESRYPEGTGVFLPAGSSVILQVHYNLLAGDGVDETEVSLRTVPGTEPLRALETMLLPAPVELPCEPGESGALCDRREAVADTVERFGGESLRTIWGLQFLCGGDLVEPKSGSTQSCRHAVNEDLTLYAAAGHMHLLGRTIRIVANPGTADEVTVLDVTNWDFDRQGAIPLPEPLPLKAGDTLEVTCTHDAGLRSQLPALADTEPRYITWGEGTTDEMCLGILTVAPA